MTDDPREILRQAGVEVPEELRDYRKVLRNAKQDHRAHQIGRAHV